MGERPMGVVIRGPPEDRVPRPHDSCDSEVSIPIDVNTQAKWTSALQDTQHRQELMSLLRRVKVFVGTPDSVRAGFIEAARPVEYDTGALIFRQGEVGNWMGVLMKGRLEREIMRDSMCGEISIGPVVPGGIIGDINLLGLSSKRTFTVSTLTKSTLLVISGNAFESLVARCGGLQGFPLLKEAARMQNSMMDVDAICTLSCFRKLDRECVVALCKHLEPRLCYPGEVLMKENNYGNEMYILQTGNVKIDLGGKTVANASDGAVLGELAVLGADKRRTATVTCTSLSLVYVLHGDSFHAVLECFPTSQRVFDHAYIARLIALDLAKVRDDIQSLNRNYGKAHPMSQAQVHQDIFGLLDNKLARSGTRSLGDTGGAATLRRVSSQSPRTGQHCKPGHKLSQFLSQEASR